jgi:hypothetical protein
MPLFEAVKQNLIPRALISNVMRGKVLSTGTQGLFRRSGAMMTNIHDKDFEGPFSPIAKEINHAV